MTLERSQVEEAAAFLFHLRVQRETARSLPHEIAPQSIEDAYAIQDAVHDGAGWPIRVLKVGCTSQFAQDTVGVPHPIGGRVPAEGVFTSGSTIPSSFFGSAPGIECEIAMQVDSQGAVTAIAPAIELVNPRIQPPRGLAGLTLVADNSGACGVVLGPALPADGAIDLADHGIELRSEGEVLATGSASAVLGGSRASVAWAHDHEKARNRGVAAGTWIITGTCTGLTPSVFGASYEADFGDLGTVSFDTTAQMGPR